jgi:hypothetical protein
MQRINLMMFKILMKVAKRTKKINEIFAKNNESAFDLVWRRSVESTASYIQLNLHNTILFPDKRQLWDLSLGMAQSDGLFLEFGVFDGGSIKYFANSHPRITFDGFDSFIGLKEAWQGNQFTEGAFSLNGKKPKVPKNVNLHAGWFDETLPGFLAQTNKKISFVHLDADTYESTKYVLETLEPRMSAGTILVFDEYFGFPNWENGEFLAWNEFCKAKSINFKYLCFTGNQAAVKID